MKVKIDDKVGNVFPVPVLSNNNDTSDSSASAFTADTGSESSALDADNINASDTNILSDNSKKREEIFNPFKSSPLFNFQPKNQFSLLTENDEQTVLECMTEYIQELDSNSVKNIGIIKSFSSQGNQENSEQCDIQELNIENYPEEEQNRVWVVNLLIDDCNNQNKSIQEQNKEDGPIKKTLDSAKILLNIGVSSEDVKEAMRLQEKDIQRLTEALNGESNESFEEAYKAITGVEYNEDKIIEYRENSDLYSVCCTTMQNAQKYQDASLSANNMKEVLDVYTQYYGNENTALTQLNKILSQEFKEIDAANKDTVNGWISSAQIVKVNGEYKVSVVRANNTTAYDENDNLTTKTTKTVTYHNLDEIENLLRTELETDAPISGRNNFIVDTQTKLNNLLGTIEGYSKENPENNLETLTKNYAESKKEAIGNADRLENLVNEYCQSQNEIIDKVASMAQFAGMGLVAVGAGVTFVAPPAGVAMMSVGSKLALAGMFSNNILNVVDGITSENGLTVDELKETIVETVKEVGYLALGKGINSVAELAQAGSLEALKDLGLSDKSAKVLSWLAEGGTDMALSVLSDVIITGDANFNGNSLQVLMGILTGVANAKVNSIQKLKNGSMQDQLEYFKKFYGENSEYYQNAEKLLSNETLASIVRNGSNFDTFEKILSLKGKNFELAKSLLSDKRVVNLINNGNISLESIISLSMLDDTSFKQIQTMLFSDNALELAIKTTSSEELDAETVRKNSSTDDTTNKDTEHIEDNATKTSSSEGLGKEAPEVGKMSNDDIISEINRLNQLCDSRERNNRLTELMYEYNKRTNVIKNLSDKNISLADLKREQLDVYYNDINRRIFGERVDSTLTDYSFEINGKKVQFCTDNDMVTENFIRQGGTANYENNIITDDILSVIQQSLVEAEAAGLDLPDKIYFTSLFAPDSRLNETEGYGLTNRASGRVFLNNKYVNENRGLPFLSHTVSHELAHLTDGNLTQGKYFYSQGCDLKIGISKSITLDDGTAVTMEMIKDCISEYATRNNVEFVAEVTANILNGNIRYIDGKYYASFPWQTNDINSIMKLYGYITKNQIIKTYP